MRFKFCVCIRDAFLDKLGRSCEALLIASAMNKLLFLFSNNKIVLPSLSDCETYFYYIIYTADV